MRNIHSVLAFIDANLDLQGNGPLFGQKSRNWLEMLLAPILGSSPSN